MFVVSSRAISAVKELGWEKECAHIGCLTCNEIKLKVCVHTKIFGY